MPPDRPEILLARLNRSRHVWDYWRNSTTSGVEIGTVRGLNVGLPTHFHAEDQITFVLAGRRRVYIGSKLIETAAGQAVRIPAGTPHRSLHEEAEVVCVNVYADAIDDDFLVDLARACRCSPPNSALQWPLSMNDHVDFGILPVAQGDIELLRQEPVAQAASRIGMTREGFSRKIKQTHGISPQGLGLIARLNNARRLLQGGHPLAAVATDSGFADQSHLGRCFLRAFGVTPGRYRGGVASVTSVL